MPGVAAVEQLNALQSALGLIGTSLFLLQAFRVNSSYGARQSSHRHVAGRDVRACVLAVCISTLPRCFMQTAGGKGGVSGIQSLRAAPTWPGIRKVWCDVNTIADVHKDPQRPASLQMPSACCCVLAVWVREKALTTRLIHWVSLYVWLHCRLQASYSVHA